MILKEKLDAIKKVLEERDSELSSRLISIFPYFRNYPHVNPIAFALRHTKNVSFINREGKGIGTRFPSFVEVFQFSGDSIEFMSPSPFFDSFYQDAPQTFYRFDWESIIEEYLVERVSKIGLYCFDYVTRSILPLMLGDPLEDELMIQRILKSNYSAHNFSIKFFFSDKFPRPSSVVAAWSYSFFLYKTFLADIYYEHDALWESLHIIPEMPPIYFKAAQLFDLLLSHEFSSF